MGVGIDTWLRLYPNEPVVCAAVGDRLDDRLRLRVADVYGTELFNEPGRTVGIVSEVFD